MEQNNKRNRTNKKRWIAVGLAVLVFLISLFSQNKVEEEKEDLRNQALTRLGMSEENTLYGTNPLQKILVVNVDGMIASDDSNDFVVDELNKAATDDTISGVILHVNSPGGSVYASERIANKVKKIQENNKPVYSVMQELAASGGYYISAPCDKIYASNETWTGSIGVIMQSYSLEGLFDKYGIKEQNITTGKMKDAGSPGSDMDKEEKEYFQGLVDSAFSRFVKIVADGRGMSEAEVKKLADGRVYDGSQAKENGLIDNIGDLEAAANDMAETNNLDDPMVVEKDDIMSSFSKYLPGFKTSVDNPKSDLEMLDKFMKENNNLPMYLYGGSNE